MHVSTPWHLATAHATANTGLCHTSTEQQPLVARYSTFSPEQIQQLFICGACLFQRPRFMPESVARM
jgi:hypothetical protein